MREETDTGENGAATAADTAPRAEGTGTPADGAHRPLSPAARRALEEAAQRRAAARGAAAQPEEIGGRDGPEPVRYGDWEVKGLATDF